MNKNGGNEFKFGQQIWLYNGAKLETWFLGKADKDVLFSTELETPDTLYRMKGTSTLFHDKASAMQSRVEILKSEIKERESEIMAVSQALEDNRHTPLRNRHTHDENSPGL